MLKKIIDRLCKLVETTPYKDTENNSTVTITGITTTTSWSADNLHVSTLTFSKIYENRQK